MTPLRQPRLVVDVFGVVALIWIAARLPLLIGASTARLDAAVPRARHALELPLEARIALATGLGPPEVQLLRDYFVDDGLVVVFLPLVDVPTDQRLFVQYGLDSPCQAIHNLLYPHPRASIVANSPTELQAAATAEREGRLIVIDLRQDDAPLPGPAEFELVHRQQNGPARVRYWSLRKAGR